MNTDLYSIINLYLRNEKDGQRINLNMRKNEEDIIFNFNMNENDPNKTSFKVLISDIKEDIPKLLNMFKQDLMIIDEKYVNTKNKYHYSVLFKNGRKLSFDNFSPLEINNIRNILYNVNINSSEIRLEDINKEKPMAYHPPVVLQQSGFASYTTLFLVAIYLTDAFLIALWIFKIIWK